MSQVKIWQIFEKKQKKQKKKTKKKQLFRLFLRLAGVGYLSLVTSKC